MPIVAILEIKKKKTTVVSANKQELCKLGENGLKLVNDISLGIESAELSEQFIQTYVNSLGCETISKYCIDYVPCKEKSLACNLYISDIKISYDGSIFTLTPIVNGVVGGATYNWNIDNSLIECVNGTSESDKVISVVTKNETVTDVMLRLEVIDSRGCIDIIDNVYNFCGDCLEENIGIVFNPSDCWDKINGNYYLPLYFDNLCGTDEDFLKKLKNISLTNNLAEIVSLDGEWYVKTNDIDAFNNAACTLGEHVYFVSSSNLWRYSYSADSMVAIGNINNGSYINNIAKEGDNFYFVEKRINGHYIEAFTFTESPFVKTVVNSLTIISNGMDIATAIATSRNRNVGGGVITGDIVFYATSDDTIYYVDVANEVSAVFSSTQYNIQDMCAIGDELFVLTKDSVQTEAYIVIFNIATKVQGSQSAIGVYSASSIFESNGGVLSLSDSTANKILKYNTLADITGQTPVIDGNLSNVPISAGVKSDESQSSLAISVTYRYCGVDKNTIVDANYHCTDKLCCEDCDVTFTASLLGDCSEEHTHNGMSGYKARITIEQTNSCNTSPINISNIVFASASNQNLELIYVGGDSYLWGVAVDFSNITATYNYTTCDNNKTSSVNITSSITSSCCDDCGGDYVFSAGVLSENCKEYETIGGINHIVLNGFASLSCSIDGRLNGITSFNIEDVNGQIVGTVIKDNGIYKYRFVESTFLNICSKPLYLTANNEECGNTITYKSSAFSVLCSIEDCAPCIGCDGNGIFEYNVDISKLCFATSSGDKKEALLPNYIKCDNDIIADFSLSVKTNTTGCNISIENRNGMNYLVITGACTTISNGALVLEVCWDKC